MGEKQRLLDQAHEAKLKASKNEEEKERLKKEKADADKKLAETKEAAEKKRREAAEYWSYGWGWMTGEKDEKEKAAKRAKDAENEAANEIVGKTKSIEKRDEEIKNAAAKAEQAYAQKEQKDAAAKNKQ